ncbi:efflux RND transporter periplasmic adaptor subunit [Niveibacterium microcysteis]|uniref:Efflux RND transporter periplasmic adaptor subunit n=1 Tax=Niveibacterium microcysteis TaxID=2811415 RepID=A0ABX7M2C1_9RHOO|nr:efflux RND transporter periplasmic adaptor subunit [Niveibacterium microcysteis]QSI75912.1 efflux RND transporter periplasmic adaptor subunit [Niveibacterium microcysteis]
MQVRKRTLLIGLVVLVVAIAISLAVKGNKAPNTAPANAATGAQNKAALTVQTVKPQQAEWPQTLSANGSIAAWQEAAVGAEIAGLRITEILVNVGDQVKKGQLLAKLANETVAADHAQTRAGVIEAEATLNEARANLERTRQLRAAGMASAQQLVQAETAVDTAQARVEAQRARLRAEDVRLAQTRVVAPDDGIISARNATAGSIAQGELFHLIRGGRLEWRGELAEAEMASVPPGTLVHLTLAGGGAAEGRLRMLAPTVDPQTRIGLAYVDLTEPGPARAGMFARGQFVLGKRAALTLPQSAVVLRDGFSYVLALDGTRVREQKVETGRRNGDRVEILAGLQPTTAVVAAGAAFLADGDTVRVAPAQN